MYLVSSQSFASGFFVIMVQSSEDLVDDSVEEIFELSKRVSSSQNMSVLGMLCDGRSGALCDDGFV